jgi:hypothetical protein
MKITRQLRLCLALATLGCTASSPALFGQALPPVQSTPPEAQAKTIPTLKIRSGFLVEAVEELSRTLEAAHLPGINVIYDPEMPAPKVPDLVLKNVSGPDALRLLTVSAGCNSEPILGSDGLVIGFHVFLPPQGPGGVGNPSPVPTGVVVDTPSGPVGAGQIPGPPGSASVTLGSPGQPALGIPGVGALADGPYPTGRQLVMNLGGMGTPNASTVRVYSLGGITNTTKFDDVEATLRDLLKADGVSADAAKLAFHQRTNVLIVTADSHVHDMVAQYLDALQKNVAAAMAEEKRSGGDRRETVEAVVRLQAERDQREKVTKQLADTEAVLRDAQRELDRLKATGPKTQ